jgi:nucleoside-diphosphate-sugar epimerase
VLPELVRANVLATANVAAAAAESGCRSFVYCSSIAVYGRVKAEEVDESVVPAPDGPYGWSKLAGEQVALAAGGGMAVAVLRLAGVHGAGRTSGAVFAMLRAATSGDPLSVTEPESRFRFVFVDDVVAAIASLLASDPAPTGVFNVGGADVMTLREMAERVRSLTGSSSPIHCATGAPARSEVVTCERLEARLGFAPEPFEVHLRRMAADLGR